MKKLFVTVLIALSFLGFHAAPQAKSLTAASAKQVQNQKVNINKAGAKEIAQVLSGIGTKKAEAIVAYRAKHGVFKSIEELAAVKGIGVRTLERNQGKIVF